MSASVEVGGVAYQYECEATCGVNLGTGERWFGTHVRWRPGIRGAWRRFNVVDLHPMDSRGVEEAVRLYIARAA